MIVQGRSIGIFNMVPTIPVLSSSQDNTTFNSEQIEEIVVLVNGINNLTADSDVVVDSADTRFRISWDVDGRSIPV